MENKTKGSGENPEGIDETANKADFILVDIPGAKFKMKKRLELDEEGKRITNISSEDAIKKLARMGYRLMTKHELFAMRDHAIKELPEGWRDYKKVEKLFGIGDFGLNEWIYDCDEVAGLRWNIGAGAGPFCAYLDCVPGSTRCDVGFHCCRDVP